VRFRAFGFRREIAVEIESVDADVEAERGELGDRIFHFRARYAQDWIVDPKFPLVWRLDKNKAGSGAMGDLASHVTDLSRFLVGEITEVSATLETFIKDRPLVDNPRKTGKVTVDDAVSWIGRFKNGALANLEATRFAWGRKNQITLEINGSKGSLTFDLEDMNRLKFFNAEGMQEKQGFTDILVTDGAVHPYIKAWWPGGHIIGYEHTFVNTFADFVTAVVNGKSVQPTFQDGLENEKVLAAIEASAKKRQWVKV
jgi:predicted dehydrogenase